MHRPWSSLLPALLLVAPACGGGGSDDDVSGTTAGPTSPAGDTTSGPGTSTTADPDPTTGGPTSTSAPMTTSSDPTQDPTATGSSTEATTDPGTTDPGTTTTGEPDPSDLPEIPDDGMPSSAHHKKVPLGSSDAMQGYWEYTPPGYGGGEQYPLLVFLHGIGENGDGSDAQLDKLLSNGPPRLIDQDQWPHERPFVVLSPQHPGGGCPGVAEVHDFLAFATSHYDINPARVYLTGLSCGAIGAWGYLGTHLDEQITALVPIAGDGVGAFNQAGCDLGRVPIWAFHGDADDVVGVNGTIEPVTKLQACDPKPDVEMLIYPGVGHDSWTMTYDLSAGHDIYAWFLARVKP
jgi:predicted esterase